MHCGTTALVWPIVDNGGITVLVGVGATLAALGPEPKLPHGCAIHAAARCLWRTGDVGD
jgi:hypothetical protein